MLNYNIKLFSYNKLFNDFINLDLLNKLPSRILLNLVDLQNVPYLKEVQTILVYS